MADVQKVARRQALGFLNEVGADSADVDVETLKAEMTRLYVMESGFKMWNKVMQRLLQENPKQHREIMALRMKIAQEETDAS